jgi:hypothetical protein
MASYLRSLDCKRVEAWLRADCERAHARAVDPGLVTVAEEIDREQALMKLAVSGLRQHAGPVVRYQAVDTHPGVSLHRGVQEAKREVYLMLPREALNAGDADADTGERLRMTRMVPVSMKE